MDTESSWVYVLPSLLPAFENMPRGFYKTEWTSWWYLLQKSILQKSSVSGHFALLISQRDLPLLQK